MRKTRQDIKLLLEGDTDEDSVILKKARYQGEMQKYKAFSRAMKLPEQMPRVYHTIPFFIFSLSARVNEILFSFPRFVNKYFPSALYTIRVVTDNVVYYLRRNENAGGLQISDSELEKEFLKVRKRVNHITS